MFSECTIESAQVRVQQVRVQQVRVHRSEYNTSKCIIMAVIAYKWKPKSPFASFMSKKADENDLKGLFWLADQWWPLMLELTLAWTGLNWFILESIVYNPVVQRSFGMFGGDSSSDNGDAALDWLAGWWPMVTRWRHHESLLWVTLTVVNHQSAV